MSTYYFFSLQVFKDIHLLFLLVGPLGISHAMNLYQIKIVGVKFLTESLNNYSSIGTFRFGYPSWSDPDFRAQSIVFPWNTFKGSSSKRMGSIAVSAIKEANSFFICLTNKRFSNPCSCDIRGTVITAEAGPDSNKG